jgi:hypothetical protein
MHHRALWIVVALVEGSCGASSGISMPSQPRVVCSDCQIVATYVAIPVASGWVGECWELHDSGGNTCKESPIPTPGSECRETKRSCKEVVHDITIHCADNRCRVGKPTRVPANGYAYTLEETRDVVITRAGSFTMDVVFKPRNGGAPRVEHIPVTAITPDGARAACTYDGSDAVVVELLAKADVLAGRHAALAVTLAGAGPCTQLNANFAAGNANTFRCPSAVKGASLEVRQPDFSTTIPVTCP